MPRGIPPSYADSTRSLYLLAAAALAAHKNDAKPPPGKPSYEERALAALASVPDLNPAADGATIRDYFAAKLTLAEIYYKAKQHEQLEALAQILAFSELPSNDPERMRQVAVATFWALSRGTPTTPGFWRRRWPGQEKETSSGRRGGGLRGIGQE